MEALDGRIGIESILSNITIRNLTMESRTNSALFKRAEQLRRWEESETNREPASARLVSRRIQFSDGCVFLSACAAGDKDEVVKLISQGADIDTPNVDGLTALHQVGESINFDLCCDDICCVHSRLILCFIAALSWIEDLLVRSSMMMTSSIYRHISY